MVIKILFLITLGFFGVFYFQIFPNISIFLFRKKICKKNYAVKLFKKKHNLLHYALCTFFANFNSHILKMDIYPFFKNVQNEKPPMNLDRPFFWDPFLEIMQYILYTYE